METQLKLLETPKPFLRWAGGKKWLKKELDALLHGKHFNVYHEPFIGGGFTLFYLNPEKSYVSDFNKELIDTYIAIKECPKSIVEKLKTFEKDRDSYYELRQTDFTNLSDRAARFIFLNQMSFNGIYRVNSKGGYNVPYGYRNNYNFDLQNIYYVSDFLQKVTIQHGDFEDSLKNISKGDLVFLDPPYTIAHNLNGFVQYNQKIFSLEDQYRLSNVIDQIKEKKAYYILTNAAHSKVKEIFDKGDKILEVSRASVISGSTTSRGQYSEYLFTNL